MMTLGAMPGSWQASFIGGLSLLVYLVGILIFVRVIFSFMPPWNHPIVTFIQRLTDPILVPFRPLMPANAMGLDISPLVALFVIYALYHLLVMLVLSL